MTEMRLRSKMAASCLGYSRARFHLTTWVWEWTCWTVGRMSPISPSRNAPGLFDLLHYISLSYLMPVYWQCCILLEQPSVIFLSFPRVSMEAPSENMRASPP